MMTKKLLLLLNGLLLWSFICPAVAQTTLDALDPTQVKGRGGQVANGLIIQQIPVKAGDSISISASVLDNTSYKGRFWKGLVKAVVPTFVLGNSNNRQRAGSGEQQTGRSSLPTVGVNLALAPGAIALSPERSDAKTFLGLTAYNSVGQQLTTVTDFMTKAARKDWEQLAVSYKVEQDGYVEIIGGKKDLDINSLGASGNGNWINVSRSSDSGAKPPGMTTNGGGGCTAWYWCNADGCTYLGTTCNYDGGGGGGGDGGGDAKPGCAECKRFADEEHDRNLTLAKTALIGAVSGGCHYAGFQTFVAFNTAGWWVNLIPGIGTGAIEALSTLGGITVDIGCLTTAVLTYNAAKATIENSYYKDKQQCKELFTDCDF